MGRPQPPPPPIPIIFEGRNRPQQTIYHWKGNLSKSPIYFRYRQNILISRLYKQFSRNDSPMAPEKVLKFDNTIYHFKGHDLETPLISIVHKIAKFRYFAKVITYSKSPDHVLQSYIYNMFIF